MNNVTLIHAEWLNAPSKIVRKHRNLVGHRCSTQGPVLHVKSVFPLPSPNQKRPKCKERPDEKKFIEDFLKLQDTILLCKAKTEQAKLTNSQRYQKRALNQLVKGIRTIANGQDF